MGTIAAIAFIALVVAVARRVNGNGKKPLPEGGDTTEPIPPAGTCHVKRRDAGFEICLTRSEQGTWSWSATLVDLVVFLDGQQEIPDPFTDDRIFATQDEALAAAWIALAGFQIEAVEQPTTRNGVTVGVDGTATVVNMPKYLGVASGAADEARSAGDDDMGVVLSVLIATLGQAINPFRVKPRAVGSGPTGGTLQQAAARVGAAGNNPVEMAKAIFGL